MDNWRKAELSNINNWRKAELSKINYCKRRSYKF